MPAPEFLWDPRPGSNMDHIASHGMTTDLWEEVYFKSTILDEDKDDPTAFIAEGRVSGKLYRIIYGLDGDIVMPVAIIPITGFPINRHGLRRRKK
jgi:hypothetical protein